LPQSAGKQHDRGSIATDIGAGGDSLEDFGEASIAAKPGEGSRDHPSTRQDLGALRIDGSIDGIEDPRDEGGDNDRRLFVGVNCRSCQVDLDAVVR